MLKKTLALLLAAFMLSALISACGSGKNAVLTVWCAEKDIPVVTAMVNEFLKTKPAVKDIVVEVCEDDKARVRFEDDPGSAADIICIPHDQLGALVNDNRLLEITGAKYVEAIDLNTMPSVRAGQVDGKQYGFPSSFETHMLFYDKSIVSETAARSLDGILSCKAPADGYLFAMDFGNAYFSANWFFTYGCRLFGESGEDSSFCDFNSVDGFDAMSYLISNRGDFGNIGNDAAVELFREHKLGAYIGGPWDAGAVTDALRGNYGCAALPDVAGRKMMSFAGFKLYCVNADTKNKTVAMDLAAWLTNSANQKARFQSRNLIPVSSALANDTDIAVSTTANALMAQGPHAIAMPSIPEMSNFWTPAGEFTLSCYNGDILLSDLQIRLDELVAVIKGS